MAEVIKKEAPVSGKKVKTSGKKRVLDGKEIKTVFYDGHHLGHGRYYAGYFPDSGKPVSESLVVDAANRPIPFAQIGEVTYV